MIDKQEFIEISEEIKNSGMPLPTQEKLLKLLEQELTRNNGKAS